MKLEYYLFALFVFALLCVLIVIYRRLMLPTKKQAAETDATKEKEERLFRLYQNIEEMMDNFEGYIEQSKEQLEQDKAQIAGQLDQVRELCRRVEEAGARLSSAAAQHKTETALAKPAVPTAEGGRPGRQDAVKELLAKGMAVEQIAQAMDVSINEIKLIVYGLTAKGLDHS